MNDFMWGAVAGAVVTLAVLFLASMCKVAGDADAASERQKLTPKEAVREFHARRP